MARVSSEDAKGGMMSYKYKTLGQLCHVFLSDLNDNEHCNCAVRVEVEGYSQPGYYHYGKSITEGDGTIDNPTGSLEVLFDLIRKSKVEESELVYSFNSIDDLQARHSKLTHVVDDKAVVRVRETYAIPRMERCPRVGCGGTFPLGQACPTCGYPGLKSLPDICSHHELYQIMIGPNAGKLGCLAKGCKAVFESYGSTISTQATKLHLSALTQLRIDDSATYPGLVLSASQIIKAPAKCTLWHGNEFPNEWYGEGKYIAFFPNNAYGLIKVKRFA